SSIQRAPREHQKSAIDARLTLTGGHRAPIRRSRRMRLYSGKIPSVGAEIVKALVEAGDIAGADRAEAEMGVQAVRKGHLRVDREITEKAKDLLQKRNLPYEQFGKIKRALAGEKAFGLGEEGLDWMTTQMIESFMQSPHIEEIFVEDTVLRKRMTEILKKHMQ